MPTRRLALVFVAVIAAFVAATGFVHWRLRSIDRAATDIAENAAPSIEHLTVARVEARHLQLLLDDALSRLERRQAPHLDAIAETRRALDAALGGYLALPLLPDERDLWRDVFRSHATLEEDLERLERLASQGDLDGAAAVVRDPLPDHLTQLNDALARGVRDSAEQTVAFAREIQAFRERGAQLALLLDVACTLIAFGGALVARRLLHEHAALIERHRRLHEERAMELEGFAGRIAHDILSPLGTVAFALSLADKQQDPAQRTRLVERGTRAVDRIKRLVDGLLDFARSGGKPTEGARASLDAALRDLLAELEPVAAEAGATLVARREHEHVVACNPGVLTSLVANLTRNAIKYLGDSEVRRVEVRARERGDFVRVEVADTGPGLPPQLEQRVFEPYVRAPNVSQHGFGLGLATVKRLAEAHGGRVGVTSVPGSGATFWFELPKAPPLPEEASAPEGPPRTPDLARA